MLPLVIQLGSIVVGQVVANQITNLIKKNQEVENGYFKRFYSTNFSSNYKQYLKLKGGIYYVKIYFSLVAFQ